MRLFLPEEDVKEKIAFIRQDLQVGKVSKCLRTKNRDKHTTVINPSKQVS